MTVFSLGPRHFILVVYGGISEWLVDKSHRDQPIVTETAVVELGKFFLVPLIIIIYSYRHLLICTSCCVYSNVK